MIQKLGRLRAAALAAALIFPFLGLGLPLVEVDDARYAEVPREMLASGDWISPTISGLDYVEKPPLWYWLAASSYRLFGVSELSARLPQAGLSVLCVAATTWLGWWLFSPATGALAAILLSSSVLFFFVSHTATPDLPLTAFLLLSCAWSLRALLRPADARWAAPLAWAACALAVLSKGLVGLLFPVLWVAGLLALYPRLREPARALLKPWGPCLFLAAVVPWFAAMERRHPGFLMFFVGEQHFQRFLTPRYNRAHPVWFFAALLPAGLLPWAPAALAGLAGAAKRWRRELPEAALALWILLVVAFFSASNSKLVTYMLPVFPHAALLAARACERPPFWSRRLSAAAGGLLGLICVGLAAASALGWAPPRLQSGVPAAAAVAAVAASFGLIGAGLLAWGAGRSILLGAAAGWGVGFIALNGLSRNEAQFSARELGRYVSQIAQPGDELWTYGIYIHGLPFYAGRRVDRIVNWVGELHYAKRDPANAPRFGDDSLMTSLPLADRRVIIVLRDFEARYVLTLLDGQKVLATRPIGRWVVLKI